MAFFDKLNQVAKNLGDKTTDAVETTKLNTKIHTEKKAVEEELKKIGEFYYNVFASGGSVAPEVWEFCQKAKEHYDVIEGAQAGINQIKAENEAAKVPAYTAPAAPVYEAPVTPTVEAAPAGNKFCPNCGNPIAEGLRFCGECGQKMF